MRPMRIKERRLAVMASAMIIIIRVFQYFCNARLGGGPDLNYICAATPHSAWLSGVNIGRRERQEAGGFAARLRQVLKGHGSASALAQAIARSEGAVRKWLRGESEPNVTDLRTISDVTHTRIDWLVTGEGPRQTQSEADAGSAVKEATPPYRHSSHATLDLPLLEAVIAAADEQLHAADLDLSPAKRSALIAAAYDLARGRNAVDAEAVARLVRLAGK
jgi:transcriptional regulator with XRE-family HTH domain